MTGVKNRAFSYMFLLINTAEPERITVALITSEGKVFKQKTAQDSKAKSSQLLILIDKLLLVNKTIRQEIEGIIVVTGPGAFSRLRTGVVTANTLAFALKIPIAEVNLQEAGDLEKIIVAGTEKIAKGGDKIVEPFYGKEPNITIKK